MFGIHSDKEVIYRGSRTEVEQQFQKDKQKFLKKNYVPVSEVWEEGRWSFWNFFVALLLCFILIGILVFIYMIIVKPKGKLTVIYGYKKDAELQGPAMKVCPMCAEEVREAAQVCKHCGHQFS